MITKELRTQLKKHNIEVDFGLTEAVKEQKKQQIREIYRQNGFEKINPKSVDFLLYCMDVQSELVDFSLQNAFSISYAINAIRGHFYLDEIIPFGMVNAIDWMTLFIDSNNEVYGIYDIFIIHYGNNPFDALTNILSGKYIDCKNVPR